VVGDKAVAGSTEPMRRDIHVHGDQRYRQGFVIEHNAQQRAQGGSCIFAHLWKSPVDPTTGCTAMAPGLMQRLLAWLRPDQDPVFVLLPKPVYDKLRGGWHLPALDGAAR
jgi:L,D-peptidoglycan transpeptidase YkuD (ErfK/YbiS/YcfS/YnhG family)